MFFWLWFCFENSFDFGANTFRGVAQFFVCCMSISFDMCLDVRMSCLLHGYLHTDPQGVHPADEVVPQVLEPCIGKRREGKIRLLCLLFWIVLIDFSAPVTKLSWEICQGYVGIRSGVKYDFRFCLRDCFDFPHYVGIDKYFPVACHSLRRVLFRPALRVLALV